MKNIKYYLKEFSGGQDLTPKQRAILTWWGLSLTMTAVCAESLVACGFFLLNFMWASRYLDQVPIPEDESDYFDDEEE